jgi:hypothetical protein
LSGKVGNTPSAALPKGPYWLKAPAARLVVLNNAKLAYWNDFTMSDPPIQIPFVLMY